MDVQLSLVIFCAKLFRTYELMQFNLLNKTKDGLKLTPSKLSYAHPQTTAILVELNYYKNWPTCNIWTDLW